MLEDEQVQRGMQVNGSRYSDAHSRCFQVVKQTIGRPRDESEEDKKARKRTVKAERQARRADKKTTKEWFDSEIKQQAQGRSKTNISRVRKL